MTMYGPKTIIEFVHYEHDYLKTDPTYEQVRDKLQELGSKYVESWNDREIPYGNVEVHIKYLAVQACAEACNYHDLLNKILTGHWFHELAKLSGCNERELGPVLESYRAILRKEI